MKMRKNFVSVLAVLLVLLLTVGSFGAAFAETPAITKPLGELTQEDIDYLRSLLVTEEGPLMGEELLAHINGFSGEELYWTLAAVSDEQYASLQEILSEDELIALFAPLQEVVYIAPRDYTNVAPLVKFSSPKAVRSAKPNQSDVEGLYMNKSAAFDPATYTGKITMESYVEGAVSTTTTIKPCDIVLVLDVSGSMKRTFSVLYETYSVNTSKTYYTADNDKITYHKTQGSIADEDWEDEGWYAENEGGYSKVTPKTSADDDNQNHMQFHTVNNAATQLDGLKVAAKNFVTNIAKDAAAKGVEHRVAIVKFAASASTVKGLTSVKAAGDADALNASINGLSAGGTTRADLAMNVAAGIIEGTKVDGQFPTDRTRVVVMFTDGEPTTDTYFEAPVANSAITNAKTLKTSSTVYTIGIYKGADPEDASRNTNNYMNGVSSNFPNAEAYTKLGTGSRTAGYFLAASDASTLNKIFDKISSNITTGAATIMLDEKTVVADTLSNTFELPEGTDADDIKVYTQASTAAGVWAERVAFDDANITVNGKTVTVTGFNFQENYVGTHVKNDGKTTEWGGKKLIIEIPFEPSDDYFGGNEIDTNAAATISNKQSDFAEDFGKPDVSVPIRYEIAADDQSIYLSNSADLSEIMEYVTGESSDFASDNGSVNYVPNGVNNADVDIVYTLKDSDGNAVATLTIGAGEKAEDNDWTWTDEKNPVLTDDEPYTVECKVTPVTEGAYDELTCTPAEGNVYVYKPQVTANDETVHYNTTVTLADRVEGEVEWTHEKDGSIPAPADKPETVLTFAVDGAVATEAVVTDETPVEIEMALADQSKTFDFAPFTTFIRNADDCGFTACDHAPTSAHMGNEEASEFVLHLGTIDLNVEKTVSGNRGDRNKAFNFIATVTTKDGEEETEATIEFALKHGETYKLEKLPVGATVEIVEDNEGYKTTIAVGDVTVKGATYTDEAITKEDMDTTIVFNNDKTVIVPEVPETGVNDTWPYYLGGCAALLLLSFVLIGVLRRNKDDVSDGE